MQFKTPLTKGKLIKRYKRFLSDIELEDGSVVTAHCPNSGSMLGLKDPGTDVYISRSDNPKRKLQYTLEMVQPGKFLVGVNTNHPNKIINAAFKEGAINELSDYSSVRAEVKYGENSRVDFLLQQDKLPDCYVEVKNVHLMREKGLAEFPDAVTARGTKHLYELINMVDQGHRAVMLYLIQRQDCLTFTVAADIDPAYAEAFLKAKDAGVEMLCYSCALSENEIKLDKPVQITDPQQ